MKHILFFILSICFTFAALAEEKSHHWNYDEINNWGNKPGFATCKIGNEQSPVNIITTSVKKTELAPINTQYASADAEMINNGHTVQLNLADGGFAKFKDKQYKLVQFHFHTPSEEKINGKNYPLGAHLVHKDESGNLGVIAILIKEGMENSVLKNVFANLPAFGAKPVSGYNINVSDFLPASLTYYRFTGSITTPPCIEGVIWKVLKEPIELSKSQIESFRAIFKNNARPTQPLNHRVIEESK